MIELEPVIKHCKPWWKSRTIQATVVAAILSLEPTAIKLADGSITPVDLARVPFVLIAAGWATYGRANAHAPLKSIGTSIK